MPKKVLLISVNACAAPYPVFPLGLGYLDAALQRAGHATEWLDLLADKQPLDAVLASFQPDMIGLSFRNVDDVSIRNQTAFFEPLIKLCRKIRALTPRPIILGGSGFSIFPVALLEKTGADFGVIGEAETTMVRLVEALEKNEDVENISGLVFRSGEKIVANPPQRAAMDEKIFPQRPARLVEYYLRASGMLNVQTQRGCPLTCCYCTYPLIEGKTPRRRAPEAVAEEFAQLQRQGAKYLFIVDSVFNSSREHVAGICEAILKKGVSLKWGCFLRPKNVDDELAQLMARAGLAHVEFGSDSFCDSVLDAYGKHFTFEDIVHSQESLQRAGVNTAHFLICGGPEETRETLQATYLNSIQLKNPIIFTMVGMRIYPGTPLFKLVEKGKVLGSEADWLYPRFFISPAMTEEGISEQLQEFSRQSPNWLVGDLPPAFAEIGARLRQKGVVGPLWEYLKALRAAP
ncbi:MAG: lipid biosynthesis B12-binding/radical SAM protein [bacterium]